MVTSKDVAKLAGVSRATVSATVNKNKHVSKKLRKRVKEAIKELNYKPDAIARSMKVKYTNIIGVVIPNILSPVFSYFISGIEEYVNKKGYNIILCNSDENYKKEYKILEVLYEKRVDGLIIIPTGNENEEYLKTNIIHFKKPIVFLDRRIKGVKADSVTGENSAGAYKATEFLINSGYKHIAIITHDTNIVPGLERLEGYKKAIIEKNIKIEKEYIKSGGSTEEDGYKSAKELLSNSKIIPDSIIVSSNHLMLIGVIKYLNENNFNIPEDIGIVGFEDLPWSRYLSTPVSVVSQPIYEMGKKAAEILIERIISKKPDYQIKNILFDSELIIRESVKSSNN